MDEISFSSQSMFAELVQRCLDCEFDDAFQAQRSFVCHCRTPVVNCYYRCDAGVGRRATNVCQSVAQRIDAS